MTPSGIELATFRLLAQCLMFVGPQYDLALCLTSGYHNFEAAYEIIENFSTRAVGCPSSEFLH